MISVTYTVPPAVEPVTVHVSTLVVVDQGTGCSSVVSLVAMEVDVDRNSVVDLVHEVVNVVAVVYVVAIGPVVTMVVFLVDVGFVT